MILRETALYPTSAVPVFQKAWQWTKSNHDFSDFSETEIDTFNTAFDQLKNKCRVKDKIKNSKAFVDLLLEYATKGNDSKSNPGLLYLQFISDKIWEHQNYVNYILDQIDKKAIIPLDKTESLVTYLKEDSLYERDEQEFKYSVYAFNLFYDDSLISKYFPNVKKQGDKRYALLTLTKNEFETLFDGAALLKSDAFDDVEDESIADIGGENEFIPVDVIESQTAYVEFSYRFFFESKSWAGNIIPAGINSTGGRNIWHYIDLYSNAGEPKPVKQKEKKQEPNEHQNDNRSKIDQLKDLIGSSKMNSRTRQQIFSLLNDLL